MKYYEEHELAYRSIKSNGFIGWGNKKTFAEMMDFSQKNELEKTLQTRNFEENTQALDLGCGTGPISFFLSKLGFKVLGIDISPTAIEEAKKMALELNSDAEFLVSNIVEDTLLNTKFKVISDSSFLHCIVFSKERQACLQNIFNLLDEDGIFILHTMVSDREVSFGEDFELDDQGILWYLSKTPRSADAREHKRGWATPQRRVLKSDDIRRELLTVGFIEIHSKFLYEETPTGPLTLFGLYRK